MCIGARACHRLRCSCQLLVPERARCAARGSCTALSSHAPATCIACPTLGVSTSTAALRGATRSTAPFSVAPQPPLATLASLASLATFASLASLATFAPGMQSLRDGS